VNHKTATQVLNKLAGELFDLKPSKRTIIFLDGPWTFEVWPTMKPDARHVVADKYATATIKIRGLHDKHIESVWYNPMGARTEKYEWSLKRWPK